MKSLYLHLIINEYSGSGNGKKNAAAIFKLLDEYQIPYQSYQTEYQGHAIEIAQTVAHKYLYTWSEYLTKKSEEPQTVFPLLVVLGGDGTLHETINALTLVDPDLPVAYIPSGSGNDFARGVGIARKPQQALQQILRADKPIRLNVLHYEEKIQPELGEFVNNVGIGLDAAIVAATNTSIAKKKLNKYKMGSLAYIFSLAQTLFHQKFFPISVDVNGQNATFSRAFLCTVTNHPYFGGGVPIAPTADPTVNNMDLVILERISFIKILGLIILLIQKKHLRSKYIYHVVSDKIRIRSTSAQQGQADGEVLGIRPYDITFTTTQRNFWFHPHQ